MESSRISRQHRTPLTRWRHLAHDRKKQRRLNGIIAKVFEYSIPCCRHVIHCFVSLLDNMNGHVFFYLNDDSNKDDVNKILYLWWKCNINVGNTSHQRDHVVSWHKSDYNEAYRQRYCSDKVPLSWQHDGSGNGLLMTWYIVVMATECWGNGNMKVLYRDNGNVFTWCRGNGSMVYLQVMTLAINQSINKSFFIAQVH